jgi:hypothetical protein
MKPQGLVTISKIVDASGKSIPLDDAVRYGWLPRDISRAPAGWGVGRGEAYLGSNLWLDQGRQVICYLLGYRSPIQDYVCSKFAVGTGTTTARATDVNLEAPITLSSGSPLGNIDTIDYLSAFVMRVAFTLGLADANGFLITEHGLYTGGNAIIARKVRSVGISKTSDFSPSLLWRLRM